jgi:hypothetical protein
VPAGESQPRRNWRAHGNSRAIGIATFAARSVKNRYSLYELPRINFTDMSGEQLERLLFA